MAASASPDKSKVKGLVEAEVATTDEILDAFDGELSIADAFVSLFAQTSNTMLCIAFYSLFHNNPLSLPRMTGIACAPFLALCLSPTAARLCEHVSNSA